MSSVIGLEFWLRRISIGRVRRRGKHGGDGASSRQLLKHEKHGL